MVTNITSSAHGPWAEAVKRSDGHRLFGTPDALRVVRSGGSAALRAMKNRLFLEFFMCDLA